MGTLNLGTMNFGDDVFVNARPDVVKVAGRLRAAGLVPECEVYDAGMLDTLGWLLARGHLAAPYHVQLVLGVPGGLSASARNLRFLVETLAEAGAGDEASAAAGVGPRPPVAWSVAGVGRHQLPMAELAREMGGHVRVGLEDNLYLSRGVLARGTDELVSRAVDLAQRAGRAPASPEEARCLLGIGHP
jgi:3-keto-5-aminohexanoate cleavage enzyme